MFKKISAAALALILIMTLLSTLLAMPVTAEPFKEIIVGEGETVIEAVWFDSGEGNYYEANPEGGNHDIRVDEEVQTYDYNINNDYVGGREGENMSAIGWIEADEWVQYTVQCEIAGMYDLSVWGAAGGGGDFVFYSDNREIGSTYVEDNGGGWQDYALYPVGQFHMTVGTHVIKVEFPDGGVNFESFAINFVEAREDAPPIVWKPKNFSIGSSKTVITATDFDPGVYGKAPADGNKDLRPDEEVNTQFNEGEFGGNIGWIAAGDWVQYTVTVQRDGIYKFDAWLASDADPTGGVVVYCDDAEVGTSPNSDKNGWQEYALYPVGEAEIIAGEHVIKVEFNGGLNISALEVARVGDIPSDEPPPTEADKADDAGSDDGETPADDAAGNTTSPKATDEGGFDPLPFIIIGAVVVLVVVIIIVLVAKAKGKKEETGKTEDKKETEIKTKDKKDKDEKK